MDYSKIRNQETKFVSLTSLSTAEFDYLLPRFEKELRRLYSRTSRGSIRLNKFKWRAELPSAAHHLFFVLTYLKENPTQAFHGAIFDISQETVSGIIKSCISALNETLRILKLLPCTHGADYERFVNELKERFIGNPYLSATQDALMDCTEIKIHRPSDKGAQKDTYSGKKKLHSVKKLIISLFCGFIVMASHHFVGSVSDKKIADEEAITFPPDTYLWTDLGFYGYQSDRVNLVIPHKKPKGKDLTEQQKKENQIISSYRVRNEHAIGGMKRCRIMKDTIRIHDTHKRSTVFSCCAGIHNLRVIFRNAA